MLIDLSANIIGSEKRKVYTVCFNEQIMENYVGLFSYQKQAILLIIF